MGRRGAEHARVELAERLRARRAEIEQATLTRIYAISDPTEMADAAYAVGLREAVSAALDYGLGAIQHGERQAPDAPGTLLVQARLAARNDVSLDTVLRRYFAGYTLLGDLMVEEAEHGGLIRGHALQVLLRDQAALFDRLVATISEEYERERSVRPEPPDQRRLERIKRLLAGDLLDTSDLGYPLESFHVGILATGPDTASLLRNQANTLGCALLMVEPDHETLWAWLAARRPPDIKRLCAELSTSESPHQSVALGEPGEGLAGWRTSHRQALAALSVAQRGRHALVSYAEVALLASVLHDDLLAESLRRIYLRPLEVERDGGAALRETLRAYFSTGRNVSSTAASLRVRRHTVASRLRGVEERIGRDLEDCSVEIEIALRLEEIDAPNLVGDSPVI
jgi:PucR C-terminal helix-turn-helix domain/GGDEF-like domain